MCLHEGNRNQDSADSLCALTQDVQILGPTLSVNGKSQCKRERDLEHVCIESAYQQKRLKYEFCWYGKLQLELAEKEMEFHEVLIIYSHWDAGKSFGFQFSVHSAPGAEEEHL